jgi:pimeloyl-ACP methyl ester carboxylesterase
MLSSFLLISLLSQAAFKPLPPPGIAVPEAERVALEGELARLKTALEAGKKSRFAPDAAIFHKAVDWALRYNQIHAAAEIGHAKSLLAVGMARAAKLEDAPWTRETGLVPLAYVSRIDDSLQPYGLVVPPAWTPGSKGAWRLDVWFHGRGETLSEVNFLRQRMTAAGEFTPPDTFVLHLYGRYCVANKFAGEMDLFEALADVKKRYRIDDNRILVRGFSMGGAATWHVAAHHAGLWAAAAPGAGFAETQEYLKITAEQRSAMPLWATKLWNWYDATAYAANLFNTPVVAYSGELDRQIQAARVMERAMAGEGLRLSHVIGPKTEHKYHAEAKPEINRRVDALAARGRVAIPRKLRFTTHTLRYPEMKWLLVDGLEEHWERARVEAEIREPGFLVVRAENVQAFTLRFGPAEFPFDAGVKPTVTVNGFPVQTGLAPESDLSWRVSFHREGLKWVAGEAPAKLRKRHGLQGPIDDAFMDRFLFVKPTGTARNQAAHEWSLREMEFAARRWQQVFRGEVRVKEDGEVTETDIAESHLVLWGDSGSNRIWNKLTGKLPVSTEGEHEVLQMIYPNPLNPGRYVVMNSGFTFREESNATNARQIPMLPDWAVIDIRQPADGRYAGKVVRAGFFDEEWQMKGR